MTTVEDLRNMRDRKAMPHLEQYAPVWIVSEQVYEEEESIQFHVMFQHSSHGWVDRRYRYDGFNNTLYHKGQTSLSEDAALDAMTADPYIESSVADIPNAYGG